MPRSIARALGFAPLLALGLLLAATGPASGQARPDLRISALDDPPLR